MRSEWALLSGEINELLHTDRADEAEKSLQEFLEIFGPKNFFLELHNHGMAQQHKSIVKLTEWAKKYGLKTVAANDVHFLNREDHEAHDIMICVGTGAANDEQHYLNRPRAVGDLHGQAPMLWAAGALLGEMKA